VAHLAYQSLTHYTPDRGEYAHLPEDESESKTDNGTQSESYKEGDRDESLTNFHRNMVFQFGCCFQIQGILVLFSVLGTAMTYRTFDFNLGFGLFFASISAMCCTLLICLDHITRLWGRQIDMNKALQRLVGMLLPVGIFCGIIFTMVELGIDISWWRASFGLVW